MMYGSAMRAHSAPGLNEAARRYGDILRELSEPVPGINSSSPWNAFTSYLTTLYFLADFFRREHRAVCAARGYREEQGIVEGS